MYVTGSDPGEMQVDHKSRVRGDDGFENLRLSTASQNQHNASLRKDNTCGHSGVNWHKPTDNWQARIRVNGKRINLGYFNDLNEAVTARKAAERKYFGDFAPS